MGSSPGICLEYKISPIWIFDTLILLWILIAHCVHSSVEDMFSDKGEKYGEVTSQGTTIDYEEPVILK